MTERIHMIQLSDDEYKFVAACVGMGIAGVDNNDMQAAKYLNWLEDNWDKMGLEKKLELINKLKIQFTPERLG